MPRLLQFAVFILVLTLVVGGGHYYLWARLVRDPQWPAPWPTIFTSLLVALGVSIPLAIPVMRSLPREAAGPFAYVVFGWMGVGFLLTTTVLLTDVVRWAVTGGAALLGMLASRGPPDPDPVRRELITRGAAGVALVAGGGLAAVALRGGLGEVETREVEVKMPRLPRELSGLTLVQLTDVHVGPTIGRRFIDQIVERTNSMRPDAVVITGDLVDGSVEELARHVEPLGRLAARYGVYFITGNHEYYSGVESWLRHLPGLGIRVLRNEHVKLGDAVSLDLAGVDDWSAGRSGSSGHGYDLERALAGRDPERELVLLAHQPAGFDRAREKGVSLQLSGHTHGGQIWPFTKLVHLAHDHVAGLTREGDASIYVSRGTGYWGPPMRLGAPAEVTKIVLV